MSDAALTMVILTAVLTVVLHVGLAVGVGLDLRRRRRHDRPVEFLIPAVWILMALLAGVVGLFVYWMVHYSNLGGRRS